MAIDEHTSRCSNTSSGNGGGGGGGRVGDSSSIAGGGSNRLSKKSKSKKVPQRGMGVAQLEKIISEEQQHKKDVISPGNSGSVQKVGSFRHPIVCCSSSSIPLPPPLPSNHHSMVAKSDRPGNMSGGGGRSLGRLWSDGAYSFESEKQNQNQGMDHSRFTGAPFSGNLDGLPYESNQSIWPPAPNLMLQRSQHFQPPCSSSMANASAGTTSSSVMNFQIEPPSNQSYCGNNYQPLWPEEEKIVGMKRPYPFSLENVPIPSLICKFPSAYSPFSRSDESASCSKGGDTTIEPALPAFRENPLNLGVVPDTISKKVIDENQILTRDFLKLAPPQVSQTQSSLCIEEQPQCENLTPLKGQSKDSTNLSGRVGSTPQSFLTFFPAAKTPMGHPGNSNGEAGESVDLNLKL